MTAAIRPLILCGGAGTRLWPTSRANLPKQFAVLLGSRSTFQDTVLRAQGKGFGEPVILTNAEHGPLVQQQLAEIGVKARVILEPARRDSAPAIAAGCLAIAQNDPDALVLILASDHLIQRNEQFCAAVKAGALAAASGHLVTFGVEPTHPETGYGYIEPGVPLTPGASSVLRFAEKPTFETAVSYVAAKMLWNSGNFLVKASVAIEEYRRFARDSLTKIERALRSATPMRTALLLGSEYGECEAVSFDYAIMERTDKAAVVGLDCGWSDIGTWESIRLTSPHDVAGNVVSGAVELVDTRDCFVATNGPLTSVLGLHDVIVVANKDAILVADRKRSAEVKNLVSQMRAHGRVEADAHRKSYRPWGWYEVVDAGSAFQVKRIHVDPGGRLSLQKHFMRAEHWVVVRGEAKVTVGNDVQVLTANQHVHIPLGAVHRLENFGSDPVELVEVQTGTYLGEDDIVRLDDVYERV